MFYIPLSSRLIGDVDLRGDRCGEPRLGEGDLDCRRGDWERERDRLGERDWLRRGERENLQNEERCFCFCQR